jgi:hypothetical protein
VYSIDVEALDEEDEDEEDEDEDAWRSQTQRWWLVWLLRMSWMWQTLEVILQEDRT